MTGCMTPRLIVTALLVVAVVMVPRLLSFLPGIIALGLMADLYRRGDGFVLPPATVWAVALGVPLLCLFSALWSPDPAFVVERTLKLAGVFVGGALFLGVARRHDVLRDPAFERGFLVGYGISLLLMASEFFLNAPLYKLANGLPLHEPMALFPLNKNFLMLACFLPFALLCLKRSGGMGRAGRIVAGLALLLLFYIVAFSDSQSALVCLLLAVPVLVMFPVRFRGAWIGAAAAIVLLTMAAPWMAMTAFGNYATRDLQSGYMATKANVGQRLEIWDFISRKALERPLTGYGAEATRLLGAFDTKQLYFDRATVLHPHNFALQLWIEFGVFGALAGAVFVAWLLLRIPALTDSLFERRILLALYVSMLVLAAMTFGLWQSWMIGLFWLMAGTVAGVFGTRVRD